MSLLSDQEVRLGFYLYITYNVEIIYQISIMSKKYLRTKKLIKSCGFFFLNKWRREGERGCVCLYVCICVFIL